MWAMGEVLAIEMRKKKGSHDSNIGGGAEEITKEKKPCTHDQQAIDQLSKEL